MRITPGSNLRRSSVTVATLLPAVLLFACGGSNVETQTETVTATSSKTSPFRPSQSQEAEGVVKGYYSRVDAGAFREAWSLLSQAVQEQQGSFVSWRDGYRLTDSTSLTSLRTLSHSGHRFEFAIRLRAVAHDVCGERVRQAFSGSWVVERLAGDFVATDIQANQTAGGQPISDVENCSAPESQAAPTPPPPSEAACDPNYEGACLDPNAADYDCAGGSGDGPLYTGYVIVVGDDHYGLDRDGNGEGCE